MSQDLTRRGLVGSAATAAALSALPARLAAQGAGPIRLGSLVPLSGGGAPFGAGIRAGQQAAVDAANAAGGVLGRTVELVSEDDQTNPEAGVRAARKLIDVDRVVAVMGCWASGVASAVAPLCWDGKVMLLCIGASDSITRLPHGGYIVRTQPSTTLQSEQFANFAVREAARHLYIMMPQTPFTDSTIKYVGEVCQQKGIKASSVVYDGKKNSFRSEVDAMIQAKPDMLMMGGYLPDTIVLAKDVYRASFAGKSVGYAYAVTPQLVEAVGKEVAEGIYGVEPVGDAESTAYARLQKALNRQALDIYTCHGYDEVNLVLLSIAAGKDASGTGVKDSVRKVGDPNGVKVDNGPDGLKAIADGKAVNYLGASGSCKFDGIGDVVNAHFRISQIRGGRIETVRIT